MRVYDIFRGTAHHGVLTVQDDGQKVWDFDREWKGFFVDAEIQHAMERAVEHNPSLPLLTTGPFTLRQRREGNTNAGL